MKNLQLTKLGFLLFLVLLCGCSDSFVIDTPAEAGNSYESDVHVLNKFVDISEPGQKYYINPNKKSTVLSYITNSDLEELNAVNSLSASRYEKSLFRLNEKISQAISSHTVDYVVMCTSSQIFVDRINDDSPIELKSAGFTTLSDNLVVSLLDISSEEMSSREIYSGNLVQTGIRLCMRWITGYSAYDVRWANRQIEKRPGCFSAELVISVPLLSIGLCSILMITGFLGTSPAKACWTKLCFQSRKWFSLNKRMSHFYNTFKLSLLFPRRGRLSVCRNSHSSGME